MKITGPEQWIEFVEKHAPKGWQDRLHFDVVLVENFGFDREVSDKLKSTTIQVQEKDSMVDVSLEHHSLRWLTKAFKGYGPVGCLTDLVNLVYAMLNLPQPAEAEEQAAIAAIEQMKDKLAKGDFKGMWIPTHLVHDAESDDSLSWLLLEHVHQLQKTQLQVLIQLPADEKIDDFVNYMKTDHPVTKLRPTRLQVFRDKDSSNQKAVESTWKAIQKIIEKK